MATHPAWKVNECHTICVSRTIPPRPAAGSESADARAALAEDLIETLEDWNPTDRLLALTTWHQGSLSLVQLMVLTILETNGPLAMTHLAEALDVSDASVTGIVDRIERRGLVERRRDSADRRVVLVHLTERGAAVFRDIRARRRAKLTALADELSDDELEGVVTAMHAFVAAVRRLHARRVAGGGPEPGHAAAAGETRVVEANR